MILKCSLYTQNFSSVEDNLSYSFPLSFMYTSTIMDIYFPISLIYKSYNIMPLNSLFFINYWVYLFILKETHPYVCEWSLKNVWILFFLVYLWLINIDKSLNLGCYDIAFGCGGCFQNQQIDMYFFVQFRLSVGILANVCENCYQIVTHEFTKLAIVFLNYN